MNDEILKLLDYSKLSDYRNELIKIIEYCWDIEHILGEKNNLNYDYFNSGINGFEQLRLLVDHSNNALMIVNILIEQIGYEGFENYKSNEKIVSLKRQKTEVDKMKSLETVDNDMLLWVQELLAHNLISLEDIPRSFRQSHSSVYVYAFRRSSYKELYKRFIADLNVLCNDIMLLETDGNREYIDSLMRTLENALIFNEHIGDERFEYYKSTVDERLLQKLQAFGDGNSKELSENMKLYKSIN